MKKIFFSIILVSLIQISPVFASDQVSLFMANWVKFNSNEGIQELPTITVTDNTGGNITPAKEISIILPKYTEILWDKSVNQITVNDSLVSISYSKDLKSINIPISKTFLAGETAIIKGHRVRVYDRAAGYQNLTLDVNGDGVSDATGVNGVQIDDTNKRTDTLAPFSPSSLSFKQDAAAVVLSWENPPDPDLYGLVLTRILSSGTSTPISADSSIGLTTTYSDTAFAPGDKLQYFLRAKDNVSNLSEPVTTTVEIPLPEAPQKIVVENNILEPPAADEIVIEKKKSILDSITEKDINNVISRYNDVSRSTESLRELVYFVKAGIIKGRNRKLNFKQSLTYGQFATFLGKAFSIERKGTYLRSLKLLRYISSTVKTGSRITKKKAMQIILQLKGFDYSTQTIAPSNTLKGNATLVDIAAWSVKIIDQGSE